MLLKKGNHLIGLFNARPGKKHIGFDIEYSAHGDRKTSTIQIAFEGKNINLFLGKVWVFHLSAIKRIPLSLNQALNIINVVSVGVSIKQDIKKLGNNFTLTI